MEERLNPIDKPVVPRKQVVTAGNIDLANVPEGLCQECGRQMVLTRCGDIPVYACMDHRIVLPLREQAGI